ncbi:flagellar hook-basal body complex protein FliE [Sphingomonas sp. RIT328]|uniref:flagellar hook-basal body complex protein FliE n=1 Tax=Sphingomonas sp. RIT328 TaxID=1470591 RepID=UPI000449DE12|nr:flagellar hook-basal body complex protein FliE [Sphingomonas sp. RIT328]EZP48700.1 Flagellar hook-basal body complex protein FliE [Sphingomonas sp. RIT328]
MSIGALDAAAAYGRALTALPGIGASADLLPDAGETTAAHPPAEVGAVAHTGTTGFGGMVQSMIGETATALRTAETESAKQVAGKGDLIDVVTAVGAAETALNTIVAVRDRMVSAYAEIMRMQI